MTAKTAKARIQELESLLNLMTEYAATHSDGANLRGSFAESSAFEAIAQGGQPLADIIEHCRELLRPEGA